MAELKKCPFCGGEAIIDREDIFCDNCHLSMRIDDRKYNGEAETYAEAREQAIEAWNNRATEAEIRAKAIDEFAEDLITTFCYDATENIGMKEKVTFYDSANIKKHILKVADQLKEE